MNIPSVVYMWDEDIHYPVCDNYDHYQALVLIPSDAHQYLQHTLGNYHTLGTEYIILYWGLVVSKPVCDNDIHYPVCDGDVHYQTSFTY